MEIRIIEVLLYLADYPVYYSKQGLDNIWVKLLICIRKKTGPKTEPCGTLETMSVQVYLKPFIVIFCFLPLRIEYIQFKSLLVIP